MGDDLEESARLGGELAALDKSSSHTAGQQNATRLLSKTNAQVRLHDVLIADDDDDRVGVDVLER